MYFNPCLSIYSLSPNFNPALLLPYFDLVNLIDRLTVREKQTHAVFMYFIIWQIRKDHEVEAMLNDVEHCLQVTVHLCGVVLKYGIKYRKSCNYSWSSQNISVKFSKTVENSFRRKSWNCGKNLYQLSRNCPVGHFLATWYSDNKRRSARPEPGLNVRLAFMLMQRAVHNQICVVAISLLKQGIDL